MGASLDAGTYAAVAPAERLVTVGSHGYVELAVNRGRGDTAFGLKRGETVYLAFDGVESA
ncbi:MAG: SAM hydroxide adenosyltransferase [Halodesulfurarchaeum sp.]